VFCENFIDWGAIFLSLTMMFMAAIRFSTVSIFFLSAKKIPAADAGDQQKEATLFVRGKSPSLRIRCF